MHEILDLPDTNIVGFEFSDTLTEDDHDALVDRLRDTMEAHTTTRAFFVMDDVDDWEPDEVWEDLAFDLRHLRTLDKVAVVGDDLWDTWTEKVHVLFPESQIETFEADDREEALDWVRGDMEVPGIGPGSVPDPTAGAQDETDNA